MRAGGACGGIFSDSGKLVHFVNKCKKRRVSDKRESSNLDDAVKLVISRLEGLVVESDDNEEKAMDDESAWENERKSAAKPSVVRLGESGEESGKARHRKKEQDQDSESDGED